MTKLTDYLQTAEAAEYLGVAQNTIRKRAARGDVPMHRNPANGDRLFNSHHRYGVILLINGVLANNIAACHALLKWTPYIENGSETYG